MPVMEPPVAMVLAAHAAEEVQGAGGVLGEVADVLVVAFVDDPVHPALAGAGLNQREAGLGVVEVFKVAFSRTTSSVSGTAPSLRWRSMSVA